jgi:hypothetical protein
MWTTAWLLSIPGSHISFSSWLRIVVLSRYQRCGFDVSWFILLHALYFPKEEVVWEYMLLSLTVAGLGGQPVEAIRLSASANASGLWMWLLCLAKSCARRGDLHELKKEGYKAVSLRHDLLTGMVDLIGLTNCSFTGAQMSSKASTFWLREVCLVADRQVSLNRQFCAHPLI